MSPLSLKRSKPEPTPFYRNRVFITGISATAVVTGIGFYARWAISEGSIIPGFVGRFIERVTTVVDEYPLLRDRKLKLDMTPLDDVVPDYSEHADKDKTVIDTPDKKD